VIRGSPGTKDFQDVEFPAAPMYRYGSWILKMYNVDLKTLSSKVECIFLSDNEDNNISRGKGKS